MESEAVKTDSAVTDRCLQNSLVILDVYLICMIIGCIILFCVSLMKFKANSLWEKDTTFFKLEPFGVVII